MKRRRNFTFSIIVLLGLGFRDIGAVSQTKPTTTNIPKKSPSAAARTVPAIKCTEPDSLVACKSFKQLVDARDKDLIDSLTGDKESKQRHFAYSCLRPKDDAFEVIEFDEPLREDFRPYSPPEGAGSLGASLFEAEALPYGEGKPASKVIDAQKKWYEDHDEFSVYQVGAVYLESWETALRPPPCLTSENGDSLCRRATAVQMSKRTSKAHIIGLQPSMRLMPTSLQPWMTGSVQELA